LEYQAAIAGDSESELFWKDRKASFHSLIPDNVRPHFAANVWSIVGVSSPTANASIKERRMIDEIVRSAYRLGVCNESGALELWLNRVQAGDLGLGVVMAPPSEQNEATLSEAEMIVLDRRLVMRAIEQDVERTASEPVPISIVGIGKDGAESQLKYLNSLLEIATPEEKPALEAKIDHCRALHTKHATELTAREEAIRAREEALRADSGPLVAEERDDLNTTPAVRDFHERATREAVVKHAAGQLGGAGKLADRIPVKYSMLRLWVRTRGQGLTKGPSERVQRIERFLEPYLAEI